MHMGMVGFVDMDMLMLLAVLMEMAVFMGSVLDRPVYAPNEVGKTEPDKEPGRNSPSHAFNVFQFQDGGSQSDPDKAQNDRAEDMAQTAEEGDE